MADNTILNSMTGGDVVAADDIDGVKFQRIKLIKGADGYNDGDISDTNPLPIEEVSAADIKAAVEALNTALQTSGITQVQLAAIKTALELIDNAISGAGFNITQIKGVAVPTGAGLEATAIRVTLPTDGTGAVKIMGADNVLVGNRLIYWYNVAPQVHVNTADTIHWDLFNAHASLLVRVLSIRQIPDIATAIAGILFNWNLIRTTGVGTGGSALTVVVPDLSQTALHADITARSKPTGGAAGDVVMRDYNIHSEETNAGTIMLNTLGGIELVPQAVTLPNSERGILLRQNQGLKCVQVTQSAAGWTGWVIVFTVE